MKKTKKIIRNKWFNMRIADNEKKEWEEKRLANGLTSLAALVRFAIKRVRK